MGGERALVLKAWAMASNQQEILAIRFSHQEAAILFAKKYQNIFPMAISTYSKAEDLFKQNDKNDKSSNNPPMWVMQKQPQPQQQAQPHNPLFGLDNAGPQQWKCAVCTFNNLAAATKCSMCGLSKSDQE